MGHQHRLRGLPGGGHHHGLGTPVESGGVTARNITIREATRADEDRWNRFLGRCPNGNFYLRYEWVRINQRELGHPSICLMAEEEGEVVGVFPMTRVRSRLFGDILASMPFVNLGGPAAGDPEVEAHLLEAALQRADGLGCDYLEIRSDRPLGELATKTHKVSMTIPLSEDPNVVWESFTSKHRKNIKRAYRNELRVEAGGVELLDDFYRVMEQGWRSLGTPLYRKSYFRAVVEEFGRDALLFVAYHKGEPVATALTGCFGTRLEGMWAAGAPARSDLWANYVLYWEMIERACKLGFRHFHLGRSTAGSGAARFKARWNAEPEQLFWNYHLVQKEGIPELNPDNPKFDLAMRTWRKLPLPATRILGPRLARLLP
ncbi:MAG: FemAB family PEP-CTERM system-associated protein [Gemmatimonadales bacterium]|nr:MAG: FemAB family PEP-CTERM system-associated protein [Gemmatimonadales bacterium]